jgi:hypothetical protein
MTHIMRFKTFCLFIGILIPTQILSAQETAPTTNPMQFSIVHGIGTHGIKSRENAYFFSFNLLSGVTGSVKGVEIGSLFNQNTQNMEGVQVAGLLNLTRKSMNGVQIAGLVNVTGNTNSIQLGGLANITDTTDGVQVGGIVNVSSITKGVQVAGIANVADDVTGIQVAGICNVAKKLNGLQIGLINVVDTVASGLPIGLFNIVKKGAYHELEVSTADYQNIGVAYKFGVPTFYTIFSAGYNIDPERLFVGGFGFGHNHRINSKTSIRPEIISYTYLPRNLNGFDDFRNTQSSHLRVGLVRKLGQHFAISLMPSFYVSIKESSNGDESGYRTTTFAPLTTYHYDWGKVELGAGLSVGISLL